MEALVLQSPSCFLSGGPVFHRGSPGPSVEALVPQWQSWIISGDPGPSMVAQFSIVAVLVPQWNELCPNSWVFGCLQNTTNHFNGYLFNLLKTLWCVGLGFFFLHFSLTQLMVLVDPDLFVLACWCFWRPKSTSYSSWIKVSAKCYKCKCSETSFQLRSKEPRLSIKPFPKGLKISSIDTCHILPWVLQFKSSLKLLKADLYLCRIVVRDEAQK